MAKAKLKLSTQNLVNCALYVVIGVLLLILRSRPDVLDILFTVIGILFIALGVYDVIVNKNLIRGVVEAVIGIAIIIIGWKLFEYALLILGILIIVKGALDFLNEFKKGPVAWIVPIVEIVIGVLLALSHVGDLFSIMCLIAAIIFFVNAVLALFGTSLAKGRK